MQRKEIDRDEYERIKEELRDPIETGGAMTVIEGQQEDHGDTCLMRQAGRFFVDADDVTLIRAKGENL